MTPDQSPPVLLETQVRAEWIDYNGHMNVAYYALLFDQALEAFLDSAGLGLDYVQSAKKSMFALESHITYQHELTLNNKVHITFQLLDMDNKFIHYFMRLYNSADNTLSATMEQISMHVDMADRRSVRFASPQLDSLRNVYEDHTGRYENPWEMGKSIGIRRSQKDN